MKWFIVFGFQLFLYLFIYFVYCQDCKKIKKENLAVSLPERLVVCFMVFTIPTLIIFLKEVIK